jgi:hypothetical protein
VVRMGNFEFDIEFLISLENASRCCGTRQMVFIKTGSKRKRHGEKFVFVFKKTLKL